jgi:hypothetical protein
MENMNAFSLSLMSVLGLAMVGCGQSTGQTAKTDTELGEDIEITQQAYSHAFANSNDADVIRKAKADRDASFSALQARVSTLVAKTNSSHDASGELKRAKDALQNATRTILFIIQQASYPTANKDVLIQQQIAAAQKVEQLESN